MRTDAINWFAFSELCRSLQDGGKTPLTVNRRSRQRPAARIRAPNISFMTGFSPKPLGMIYALSPRVRTQSLERIVVY